MTTTTTPLGAPILARLGDLLVLLDGVKPSMDADSKANQLLRARDDLRALLAAPTPFVLEMNEHTEMILNRTRFQASAVARSLRAGGQVIAATTDAEIAAATLFLLNHYFASGADWFDVAHADLDRMEQLRAARVPPAADGGVLEGTNRTTSGAIGQP